MLIIDTDILSMFAKADALDVLMLLFGREQIGMTPAIADEITVPLQYGYDFPASCRYRRFYGRSGSADSKRKRTSKPCSTV
jgi:hypothetical protein